MVEWPDGLRDLDLKRYSTIIHLATPNVSNASVDEYLTPLRHLNQAILRDNPSCHLISLSSLSASPDSSSHYGRGKWAIEDYLAKSTLNWTILRPGLVVDLVRPRGLFGAIFRAINALPIIPVPDGPGVRVQPVMLVDVIKAISKVISDPGKYRSQILNLALPPRSLATFAHDLSIELGLKRWIAPIPVSLTLASLRAIETVIPRFPIKGSNLQGLLCGAAVNSSDSLVQLGIKLSNIGMSEMINGSDEYLSWEASHIFRKIFKMDPTPRIISRYVEAHRQVLTLKRQDLISVQDLIKQGYSIEMVERANRTEYPNISAKFMILSYLAEVDPQYSELFVLRKRSRIKGWIRLVLGVLRAVASLAYCKLTSRRMRTISLHQSK